MGDFRNGGGEEEEEVNLEETKMRAYFKEREVAYAKIIGIKE
jgi:hypothetical protein